MHVFNIRKGREKSGTPHADMHVFMASILLLIARLFLCATCEKVAEFCMLELNNSIYYWGSLLLLELGDNPPLL